MSSVRDIHVHRTQLLIQVHEHDDDDAHHQTNKILNNFVNQQNLTIRFVL